VRDTLQVLPHNALLLLLPQLLSLQKGSHLHVYEHSVVAYVVFDLVLGIIHWLPLPLGLEVIMAVLSCMD
jgi:hypothetical protein